METKYVIPNTCDGVNVEVVYDGGENRMCIGRGCDDKGNENIYVRWNGDKEKPAGFPLGSFGKSSWFTLPLASADLSVLTEEIALSKIARRIGK